LNAYITNPVNKYCLPLTSLKHDGETVVYSHVNKIYITRWTFTWKSMHCLMFSMRVVFFRWWSSEFILGQY